MRQRRALLALGAVLVLAGVAASIVLWKTTRALRNSSAEVARETDLAFTSNILNTTPPPGFETVAAPAGFRDAAIFAGHIYIAGGGGLYEYDPEGNLLRSFRTGLELPAAPVTAVATGTAHLWLATSGEGALSFDGRQFRHIRPHRTGHRKLTAVLPLSTGRILFGTEKAGVLAFDGRQLSPLHPSLSALHVTALAGDEASLWIGTQDSGVRHWHAGQLDTIGETQGLPDPRVFSIAVDHETAYIATALGVAEVRDDKVQRVLAQGFTVQSVLKHGGQLLAGTLDEGLIRVPGTTGSPDAAEPIQRLLSTSDSVLALMPTGLYRIGSKRSEWSPVLSAAKARLTDRNIAALAPDREGRLWIGYFDRGLDILDSTSQHAQHLEDDILFCVNRIVPDREHDRTAVATANGLVLFGAGGVKRQVLTRSDGLIANQVTDVIVRPDGTMIAATPAGVSFIESSRISSIYAFHGLVNNHVYSLGQIGNRTLVGTLGGLSIIESGFASASFTTANSGLKANWITAVLPTQNDVFIGTYGGGIMHMGTGGSWTPFADLPPNFEVNTNAMVASGRAVYAGTLDRGLAVFDRASSRWHWVTRGLPSMNVTAVALESDMLYIGTDNGLVRVPEEAVVR